jgi:hypothetical protein
VHQDLGVPLGIGAYRLANENRIPQTRIAEECVSLNQMNIESGPILPIGLLIASRLVAYARNKTGRIASRVGGKDMNNNFYGVTDR